MKNYGEKSRSRIYIYFLIQLAFFFFLRTKSSVEMVPDPKSTPELVPEVISNQDCPVRAR